MTVIIDRAGSTLFRGPAEKWLYPADFTLPEALMWPGKLASPP